MEILIEIISFIVSLACAVYVWYHVGKHDSLRSLLQQLHKSYTEALNLVSKQELTIRLLETRNKELEQKIKQYENETTPQQN